LLSAAAAKKKESGGWSAGTRGGDEEEIGDGGEVGCVAAREGVAFGEGDEGWVAVDVVRVCGIVLGFLVDHGEVDVRVIACKSVDRGPYDGTGSALGG